MCVCVCIYGVQWRKINHRGGISGAVTASQGVLCWPDLGGGRVWHVVTGKVLSVGTWKVWPVGTGRVWPVRTGSVWTLGSGRVWPVGTGRVWPIGIERVWPVGTRRVVFNGGRSGKVSQEGDTGAEI